MNMLWAKCTNHAEHSATPTYGDTLVLSTCLSRAGSTACNRSYHMLRNSTSLRVGAATVPLFATSKINDKRRNFSNKIN